MAFDHLPGLGGLGAGSRERAGVGTALLAAIGLDGQPPAQASSPAAVRREAAAPAKHRQVRLLFYSGNWQALMFLGSRTHGNLPVGQTAPTRLESSRPGEKGRGFEPGERWTCRGTSFAIYGSRVIVQSQAERGVVSSSPRMRFF